MAEEWCHPTEPVRARKGITVGVLRRTPRQTLPGASQEVEIGAVNWEESGQLNLTYQAVVVGSANEAMRDCRRVCEEKHLSGG